MNNISIYNNFTILTGYAEALSAPEAVWSLVDYGFNVVVFSRLGCKTPLQHYKKIQIHEVCAPEIDVNQTINDIKDIISHFNPNIIMPLDDSSVWICNKMALEITIKNTGPIGLQADFALDKGLQIEAAERAGLRIIPSYNITNLSDLDNIDEFPVLLKSAMARFEANGKLISGHQYRCTKKSELLNVARKWKGSYPMLAQPIISGVGEGIFGLSTEDGVKAWSAHRRVRMMNPLGSGSSACESIQITDHPLDHIESMLASVQWRGIFMVELIRDKHNQLWFMEMNGRPWGSMALARRCGYEYPVWSILYTIDSSFQPVIPIEYKKILCRHLGREILHLLMVLRRPKSSAELTWPPLGRTIIDLFKLKRNHKWYNWQKGETLFFIEDTYRTVVELLRKKLGP